MSNPQNIQNMQTSNAGLALIKEFEGFRDKAYVCPAGVVTIGYGTTVYKGAGRSGNVQMGDSISEPEAAKLLAADVQKFEKNVKELVKVPLTQGQFDALVSFTYNCGEAALADSTLLKKLNAGDYKGAQAEFDKWNKGDGTILAGLVRRRDAEQALFDSDGSVALAATTNAATGVTAPSSQSLSAIIYDMDANGLKPTADGLRAIEAEYKAKNGNVSENIAKQLTTLQNNINELYKTNGIALTPETQMLSQHLGPFSAAVLLKADDKALLTQATATINGKPTQINPEALKIFKQEIGAGADIDTVAELKTAAKAFYEKQQGVAQDLATRKKENKLSESETKEMDFFEQITKSMQQQGGFLGLVIGFLSIMMQQKKEEEKTINQSQAADPTNDIPIAPASNTKENKPAATPITFGGDTTKTLPLPSTPSLTIPSTQARIP